MKKAKRKSPRHTFIFKLEDGSEPITARAKVKRPKKGVDLLLTADDVRQSIKMDGMGNTQKCTMAVCAKRHAKAFSHPVEGFIDWLYSRAFVVSKVSKQTHLPIECYEYEHSDSIARLNDTKGGQQHLLQELEREGDRIIRLLPVRRQKKPGGKAEGRRDGSRSGRSIGAKLRFAIAQLGGVA